MYTTHESMRNFNLTVGANLPVPASFGTAFGFGGSSHPQPVKSPVQSAHLQDAVTMALKFHLDSHYISIRYLELCCLHIFFQLQKSTRSWSFLSITLYIDMRMYIYIHTRKQIYLQSH